MKKIFAISAALLLTISAFAQDGKSIYNKYSDAKDVSAVYISPAMFRIMGKLPEMDVAESEIDLSKLIKTLTGFYLIDSENPDITAKLLKDADRFVRNGSYEMLMEVKDDGEIVHMYTMGNEQIVTGFVMIVQDGTKSTFLCLDGKMSRKELEEMITEQAS